MSEPENVTICLEPEPSSQSTLSLEPTSEDPLQENVPEQSQKVLEQPQENDQEMMNMFASVWVKIEVEEKEEQAASPRDSPVASDT